MNDRELLELAAKAAGVELEITLHQGGGVSFGAERSFKPSSGIGGGIDVRGWSPLEDDGDALRLAIHIGIFDGPSSFAKFYPWLSDALVIIDDYTAAFKRAVTCYAAEIGRTMP